MKLQDYAKQIEKDNQDRKKQILKALKEGPASQRELRDRLGIGHDDEMICDMCWSLCIELKEAGKVKEKNKIWSLAC